MLILAESQANAQAASAAKRVRRTHGKPIFTAECGRDESSQRLQQPMRPRAKRQSIVQEWRGWCCDGNVLLRPCFIAGARKPKRLNAEAEEATMRVA